MKLFKLKRMAAALTCAAVITNTLYISAEAEEIGHITILGDSISSGYALDDDEKNYGNWLGEFYNAKVENFAVMGYTTQNLLDNLKEEQVIDSVEKSDLICVSIGANDVMDAVFSDLRSISPETGSQLGDMKDAIEASAEQMKKAADIAADNIGIISQILCELNPDARLVFQTVYIPFETDNEEYKGLLSMLSLFAGLYLAPVNAAVRSNERVMSADIQKKFRGMCQSLTNISRFDIHPNRLGHLVIAEEIAQKVGVGGEYSVIKNAFDLLAQNDISYLDAELLSEFEQFGNGNFRPQPTENATQSETQPVTEEKSVKTQKHEYVIWLAAGGAAVLSAAIILLIKRKGKDK